MRVAAYDRRFQELEEQFEALDKTKSYESGRYSGAGYYVDHIAHRALRTKVRNFLTVLCGSQHNLLSDFERVREESSYATNHSTLLSELAVLKAIREEYEGGFIASAQKLIAADLFANELEQAAELLSGGYLTAAAVISGVVLETTLRQLCTRSELPIGKLDKMNADLAKAGVFSLLVQKRITALADIRNNAAHGHADRFNQSDVRDMIAYVGEFAEGYL